jgi:hypothetical protein
MIIFVTAVTEIASFSNLNNESPTTSLEVKLSLSVIKTCVGVVSAGGVLSPLLWSQEGPPLVHSFMCGVEV